MTNNQIKYQEHTERMRSNRANEAETNRHNLAMEGLQYYANQETIRSHKASEAETNRSNVAREKETTRANKANEVLKSQANTISAAVQRETAQHNRAMEERDLLNLTQQSYFNTWTASTRDKELEHKGKELRLKEDQVDIEAAKHSETVRHNLAMEDIQYASNVGSLIGSAIGSLGRLLGGMKLK